MATGKPVTIAAFRADLSSLPTAIDEIYCNEYIPCGKHLTEKIKLLKSPSNKPSQPES
jgi:hypothetical protein